MDARDIHYYKSHGLELEDVQAALIRRVNSSAGAELVGRRAYASSDYSGTVFPYIWPGEDRPREYRLRRDNPDLELQSDGTIKERAKYLSPPGRRSQLYFKPRTPARWLTDTSLDVAIVEGEWKTLALEKLSWYGIQGDRPRFLPIGLAGVWNWRSVVGKIQGPNGERRDVKGVIPDLDRVSWSGRKVWIVFDSDVAVNVSVMHARRMLGRELKRRGAVVYLVDIPKPGA